MKSRKNDSIFDSVKTNKPDSSSFSNSHDYKVTLDMGYLVPTMAMEILPGDKHEIAIENFIRFAPMVTPVMHNIKVKTYKFFVPYRILWKEWQNWYVGESTAEHPYITGLTEANGWASGTTCEYMGIPASSPSFPEQKISPWAVASYYKIYDEYFRDQNLIEEKYEELISGDNSANYLSKFVAKPLKKAWEHDYFTSGLPWEQKGDPVLLPLTANDDIPIEQIPWAGVPNAYPAFTKADGTDELNLDGIRGNATGIFKDGNGSYLSYDPNGTLVAKLNAEAVTINSLRTAIKIQEYLEKNAHGGTRYIENLRAHFNVRSSDSRLQRPEFIGMETQSVRISEVLSSAQTIDQNNNDVPVGMMAGHGISMGGGKRHFFKAEEHGTIITLMCVIPDTSYFQGLHPMHQRFTPLSYAVPSFANLGEQPIYVKELRNDVGTKEDLNEVFAYTPRYSPYKYQNSRVAGDFRTTLNNWHLARTWELDQLPALNEEFIEANVSKRIFAVTDEDLHSLWCHVFFTIKSIRRLPKYGVPQI